MTNDQGREHVGADCTLDGKPATIIGRLNMVATVAQLPPFMECHDWSWPAVARIMQAGGRFES